MREPQTRFRPGAAAAFAAAALPALVLGVAPARAADGGSGTAPYGEYVTYYEYMMEQLSEEERESAVPDVPSSLYLVDVDEVMRYERTDLGANELEWLVRMEPIYRSHEKIDAVYGMLLLLPLPVASDGLPAWTSHGEGMMVWQGSSGGPAAFVYGGEELVLKRDEALEMKLIPALRTDSGEPGKIPSLEGTGYAYTVWSALVKYDWDYGVRLGPWITFRYRTDASVQAPDAGDERLKAYVVTWIPELGDLVAPYALQIDVAPPEAP